jgi:hypothetical protein
MQMKYKWLKLPEHFFADVDVGSLAMSYGGSDAVVLYLRLLLFSMNSGGLVLTGRGGKTELKDLSCQMGLPLQELKDNLARLKASNLVRQNPSGECYVEVGRYVGRDMETTRPIAPMGGNADRDHVRAVREQQERQKQEAVQALLRQRMQYMERSRGD